MKRKAGQSCNVLAPVFERYGDLANAPAHPAAYLEKHGEDAEARKKLAELEGKIRQEAPRNMHRYSFVAVVLMFACTVLARPAAGQAPQSDVFALLRTIDDEGASERAWPGFRPSDWPLAVFDGTRTLLLRHPAPPSEFKPLDGHPGVLAAPGRHPAIVDGSTVDLAGTRTATLVVTPGRGNALAALAEELFHVFWLQRHKNFRPNEMARYAYPMKDVHNRQRVLAEHEALARALEAPDSAQAVSWAATAHQVRRERAAHLTSDDQAFETAMEMMEGTANAVARTIVGMKPSDTAQQVRQQGERAAEELRWRYYDSGAAICLLLDRLAAPAPARDWKSRIDAEPETTTVALLAEVVTRAAAQPARFTAEELAGFERRASAAIADLTARQARLREDLQSRAGVRVVVEIAPGHDPLRVTFDPLTLFVLDGGEVVHPRYLTLSVPDGTIDVTNPDFSRGSFGGVVCLTRAAGRHPLAGGVRGLTLVGLKKPSVESGWDGVTVETDGVRITLKGATLERDAETIRITLGAAGSRASEGNGCGREGGASRRVSPE
jgi:hypothetical protein